MFDSLAAVHVADRLVREQEQGDVDGGSEVAVEDYVARLGVDDRLGAWRALAAEHMHAGS